MSEERTWKPREGRGSSSSSSVAWVEWALAWRRCRRLPAPSCHSPHQRRENTERGNCGGAGRTACAEGAGRGGGIPTACLQLRLRLLLLLSA